MMTQVTQLTQLLEEKIYNWSRPRKGPIWIAILLGGFTILLLFLQLLECSLTPLHFHILTTI